MPAGHIPVALLFFNIGVEAGQLSRSGRDGTDRRLAVGSAAARRSGLLCPSLPNWDRGDVLGHFSEFLVFWA